MWEYNETIPEIERNIPGFMMFMDISCWLRGNWNVEENSEDTIRNAGDIIGN